VVDGPNHLSNADLRELRHPTGAPRGDRPPGANASRSSPAGFDGVQPPLNT
jgi:hypothetical protein